MELGDSKVWDKPERAQELGRERAALEAVVRTLEDMETGLNDVSDLLEMAAAEDDTDTVTAIEADLDALRKKLEVLEFRRMYLRWGDAKGFKTELIEASAGDVAGIKSATISFQGEYAYGWLRTETGVHRLVRKSPFDSGNRRHTSFSSVFVSPEIDDKILIDINPADLKTDVYRASGAGGQHVNKTESAVRITHIPSGIIVQCQNQRSQHANRDFAMKQLAAKLYEMEMQKRREKAQLVEDNKADVGWGSQIRSYVLDDARIKDLRTGVETRNTQAVLDGDLDKFIEASLKSGL